MLVSGATGFIGAHLVGALRARGHTVVAAARRPQALLERFPDLQVVAVDYRRDQSPRDWLPLLADVEAVVNAVGIFREGAARFEDLHVSGPRALFDACVEAGVRRVIQISALGADEGAQTDYHRSKHTADRHLRRLPLEWTIVQPSLVYGPGGASARLFTGLASLPVIPLPGRGTQVVQPIFIDDLVAALLALLEHGRLIHHTLPAVGPQPLTLREMLARLRGALGLPPGRFLAMPMPLVRLSTSLAERLPGALLTRDSLRMLERGNQADATNVTDVLGRPPRAPQAFVDPEHRPAVRRNAQLTWLLPLLRLSIALVWLGSGLVSLGLYPVERSYALLAGVGITGPLAPGVLYGAALLDIGLGVATLVLRRRRALWLFQIALILGYSVIIAVYLPQFWLHPFAPLLKNLPMLAALTVLLVLER